MSFTGVFVLVDRERRNNLLSNTKETSFSYFETRCRVPTQAGKSQRKVN